MMLLTIESLRHKILQIFLESSSSTITRLEQTDTDLYTSQVPVSKVQTVALLFESLVFSSGGPDLQSDPLRLHCLLATIFAWCLTWGVGGNLEEQCNDKFDSFVKDLLSDCPDVKVNNCSF